MELVGHPEVIDQEWFKDGRGRVAHVDEIDQYLQDWISVRDRDEVIRAFEEAQAAIAPIYDARDIVEDAQVKATDMLVEVPDDDLGSVLMHNVMWKMSKTPGQIGFTGRGIGQDSRDVLINELGVTEDEFEGLRADGVVGCVMRFSMSLVVEYLSTISAVHSFKVCLSRQIIRRSGIPCRDGMVTWCAQMEVQPLTI
jgi:crotonobetainyl-CoA:carnitine CoA-transferase CaiB-like acyl-CoA transferase